MRFEWDSGKARLNLLKHGISFFEAVECFEDPLGLFLDEPRHADRLILIARSREQKLIFTVYATIDIALVRIISARRAVARERKLYEEGDQ